ncbi:hypothetical protein GQ44DRAFT_696275 [Phaeosphaeriaceae sp. PMI808]|nr:hypothetical protein GQ44DRAFT_696275 [Phaeosphaeriaceae sp. PMI808]
MSVISLHSHARLKVFPSFGPHAPRQAPWTLMSSWLTSPHHDSLRLSAPYLAVILPSALLDRWKLNTSLHVSSCRYLLEPKPDKLKSKIRPHQEQEAQPHQQTTTMTTETPISPPISTPPAPRTDGPISPVSSRSSTFAHKTSPSVATRTPLIDTATPAINDAPVELDGIPTSPEALKRRIIDAGTTGAGILSPEEQEDIDGEFLGEGESAGRGVKEKRAAILASRSKDPGVIVDVPQYPTAEEVEAARNEDAIKRALR